MEDEGGRTVMKMAKRVTRAMAVRMMTGKGNADRVRPAMTASKAADKLVRRRATIPAVYVLADYQCLVEPGYWLRGNVAALRCPP